MYNYLDLERRWARTIGRQYQRLSTNWESLATINSAIENLTSQLSLYHKAIAKLHGEPSSMVLVPWIEPFAMHFARLLSRAHTLRLSRAHIVAARVLADTDLQDACKFLEDEIHRVFVSRISRLRAFLRAAKFLKTQLLRLAARCHKFHDKITLQRRFYLTHGAHPVDTTGDDRRISRWGCGPALSF